MSARLLLASVALTAASWLWALPPAAQAAEPAVEAILSADTISMGEPVALRIRLRGAAASSEPDLAPLAHDFEVLDVQQSQRTVIANGVRDASVDWIVELLPRREGELPIPALSVGGLSTQPARILVRASRAGAEPGVAQEMPAAPVLLEVHADRQEPYQHERVLLRVQLLASGDVTEGALAAPEIPGSVVEPIGEDRRIEKEVDGRRYRGIERSYAFLPEASGDLVISPVRFEGRMRAPRPAPEARRPNGFFGGSFQDFFSDSAFDDDLLAGFLGVGSRHVAIESEPVALRVRPRPEAAAGQWWLPAREVALSERWDPAAGPVHVGEPLTRRIELRADGAAPSQLPALPAAEVDGVKQYAEAPKVTESERGTLRVGETTLIPTRPGAITLPAVEVAWWDTQADAPRMATLPERTVEVLPAAAGSGTPAGATAARAATAAPTPGSALRADVPLPSAGAAHPDPRLPETLLAAALAAGLLLLGVGVARRRGRSPGQNSGSPPTRRSAERALRRACRRHRPAAAEAALRALGRTLAREGETLPGTRWALGLGAPGLAQEIARLQALRYLSEDERWNGAALWKAWRAARATRRRARARRALPPLYPGQESIPR